MREAVYSPRVLVASESPPLPAPRRAAAERALGLLVRGVLAMPLAFGCGALGVGLAYDPDEVGRGVFYSAVGVTPPQCAGCPMCGMSRAFSALLHGDLPGAFAFNHLVVLAFPAVLVLAGAALYGIVALTRRPLALQPAPLAPAPTRRLSSSSSPPHPPGLSVRVSQGEP